MEQAKFYLQEFLFVIFYKIHIVIGIPCFIIFLALIYVFSAKPLYMTSSSILLKPFFDSRDLLAQGGFLSVSPVTQIDINTEIEILNSKDLALEVGKKLKIKPVEKKDSLKVRLGISAKSTPEDEIINYITEGLDIYSVVMSSVIRVQKTGESPYDITDIVNAYVDKYVEKHITTHRSNSEIHLYQQDMKEKKEELEEKRLKLQDFIKKNNLLHIEAQKLNNIELKKSLNGELSKIENDIIEKKIAIERARVNPDAMIEEFRNSQFIATIRNGYIDLLKKKSNISSLYNENSIEYKNIINEIKTFEEEIQTEKKKIINGLEIEMKILKEKKKNIENSIMSLNIESLRISQLQVDYENYNEDIKMLSGIYDLYVKKIEEERIQARKDTKGVSNISIISYAYPPSRPVLPKRTMILAISVIAGSLTGLGAGFAAYYFDHTVKNSNDVERITKSPVISLLEHVDGK